MRVLIVAPHITNESHSQFLKNLTGLGRIINDMAVYIGRKESVDVFTLSAMTPTMQVDGFRVIGRSWLKVLCGFKLRLLLLFNKYKKRYGFKGKANIRILYYFISLGQVEKIINEYDIVHVHGCFSATYGMIGICKRHKIPMLITLHGLISFGGEQTKDERMMRYERDLLRIAYKDNIPLSFISTGNMLTVCDFLGVENVPHFHVVTNGCDIQPKDIIYDIREKYDLKKNDFVIAYVANISENKNQRQVVEAFSIMDKQTRSYIKVLFVGRDGEELKQMIQNYGLQDSLIVCGGIPRNEVGDYYQASNATILTSHSEGFGLSIIEGYVYGKPCLTFADMPAVKDLYHEKAMLTLPDRNNTTLAEGIEKFAGCQWDEKWIKDYSKQFSLDNMANNYIKVYHAIIGNNNQRSKNNKKI